MAGPHHGAPPGRRGSCLRRAEAPAWTAAHAVSCLPACLAWLPCTGVVRGWEELEQIVDSGFGSLVAAAAYVDGGDGLVANALREHDRWAAVAVPRTAQPPGMHAASGPLAACTLLPMPAAAAAKAVLPRAPVTHCAATAAPLPPAGSRSS